MAKSGSPVGPMCSESEVRRAFDAPGKAGKDVEAAGRVSAVGGMKKEPGQPKRTAGGPGPANG